MTQPATPMITLNNGVTIPQLGLGVWKAQDGAEVEAAVTAAIDAGYRLIDTAAIYGNETGVGKAIAASGVAREELFITTKLWNADQGYDATLKAFDTSLTKLGLDYVDLYLIHWPMPARGLFGETWRAFEKLYADGRVKSIGVSNFQPAHLDELMKTATVKPVVNQIELHPYFPQLELRKYANDHDIQVQSWSPIGGASGGLLKEPVLREIGDKYDKSPAQVVIRWHIQNGLIVIPKSVHADRIQQNIAVFDFELRDDDMVAINALQNDVRFGPNPENFN